MNDKSGKWEELTNLTRQFHDKQIAERHRIFWFVGRLRNQFSEYVGCPDPGRVMLYRYDAGRTPEDDHFVRVDHVAEALGRDDTGYWTFGMGITLERDQGTFPRFAFHWGMRVISGSVWRCEVGLSNEFLEIPEQPDESLDFTILCAALHSALVTTLKAGIDGKPVDRRMGFAIQD